MHKLLLCLLAVCTTLVGAETYKIAVVPKALSNQYWDGVHAGVQKAVRELKAQGVQIDLIWTAPDSEDQVDRQIEMLNDVIKQKVNGLVMAPCDSVLVSPVVQAAVNAKIPTVVIDSGLKAAGQISFISTDNFKGGVMGARRLGAILEGKGNVILFRSRKGAGGTEQREKGFLDTMKNQYPGIKVISSDQYAGGTYETAEKVAGDLVKSLGAQANGAFGSNLISTHGMLVALKQNGLAGKVKLVGFDSSEETLAALKSGDMQGTVAQNPINMGYLGVMTVVQHLQGKKIEAEIDTGCVMVSAENMNTPSVAEVIRKPELEKN